MLEANGIGMEIKNITDHYHERLQRILLFQPLYKLNRLEVDLRGGGKLPCMGLGLLTLLFFFENMLLRKKKVGVRELAAFLAEMTQDILDLDDQGYEKTARMIIAAFRPSSGRRNMIDFFNWETKSVDQVQYSILKAHKADIVENTQYYILDEQGLELIFATKEYFSEFQLSINQLILRKQLEKGEFALALRQIDEMHLDVNALRDRIVKVGNEVHRNIISEETLARYSRIISDINLRMEHEDQEFKELKEFVKSTRNQVGDNIANELDRKAYENILDVDRELGIVHMEHRQLLKMTIELKTLALSAAEESLYFTGVELFNFQQEITKRMFASPLPLSAARTLIEPFMELEKTALWSPLTVFAPQRLETEAKESVQAEFPEISTEESYEAVAIKNLQVHYLQIMRLLADALGEAREITLSTFMDWLRQHDQTALLRSKQFYLFWIFLHRKSPFVFDVKEISDKSAFYQAVQAMPAIRQIVTTELSDILQIDDKFQINDMKLVVEEA